MPGKAKSILPWKRVWMTVSFFLLPSGEQRRDYTHKGGADMYSVVIKPYVLSNLLKKIRDITAKRAVEDVEDS
jgi:hypothetical protein